MLEENVNRRTLYNWFQQKELNADIIYGIGEVINYDFSDDFQEGLKNQPLKASNKRKSVSKAQGHSSDTVLFWMEKYITLLEEYRVLLQRTSVIQSQDDFKSGPN